ncbi:MAG: hypothetical protein FWE01_01325 [Firmicutes bacterium]|nr:hypothetical protein [Bacillota bacterium]
MMTRRKKFFLWLFVLILIGVGIWLVVHFTTRPNRDYNVVGLGSDNIGNFTVSQFSQSRLQLHTSGAFNLEIIVNLDENLYRTIFVATGYFERARRQITFSFVDAWMYVVGQGTVRDGTGGFEQRYIGESHIFNISSSGIIFYDHDGQRYYLRR